eukprot:9483226-Pyramimonas_sp.AAC.1
MKRFFQPVPTTGSGVSGGVATGGAGNHDEGENRAKAPRIERAEGEAGARPDPGPQPHCFISWNANGAPT